MTTVYLDVEASSLHDGYPVEIGWCSADLVYGQNYLIAPDDWPHWLGWDPAAEALHGLSVERLTQASAPPWVVAQQLKVDLAKLGATRVLSDSPGYDQAWLAELCALDGPPELPFTLEQGDRDFAEPLVDAVRRVTRAAGLVQHRALDDAIWQAAAACLAGGMAEDEVARRARDLLAREGRKEP